MMFTLSEALEAIKDKPEFRAVHREFGTVIDYALETESTFVGKTERESMILTNLRGTCFFPDGEISRLMYHKFKNVGQSTEYAPDTFDLSQPHKIEEKLDGSLIGPIMFPDGHWVLGTRAGITDVSMLASKFLTELSTTDYARWAQYRELIDVCLSLDLTPLFEFVSRANKIVIDYIDPNLILTGIRSTLNGKYSDITTIKSIYPLVSQVEVLTTEKSNINDLISLVRDWPQTQEGVVVKFSSGRFCKIKGGAYVLAHRTLDGIRHEKNVLELVMTNAIDDILPIVDADTRSMLTQYAESVNHFIDMHNYRLNSEFKVLKAQAGEDRAKFANLVKENAMIYSTGLFKMFSGQSFDMREIVKKSYGSSTAVESIRWLIGPSYFIFKP